MESMNGFAHAQLSRTLQLHTTYTPQFLGLSDWSPTWGESLYGEGTVIGVLDTGAFSGGEKQLVLDAEGHGTHVAGIAAGNFVEDAEVLGMAKGLASGVAPKSHLAIYKVCDRGGCDEGDVIAGIDQAIRDGVDVMLMPFGGLPNDVYRDSIAIASLAAVEKGIMVCASAGNIGPRKSTVSHEAPWILTVGATSTDRRIRVTVKLGNGMILNGESAFQPSGIISSNLLPIVFPGIDGDVASLNCYRGSLDDIDVRGKIVLCHNEGTNNTEKGDVVKDAGGAGMIIMNRQSQGFTVSAEVHSLAASHISYIDGRKIRSYVYLSTNSTPMASMIFKRTVFGSHPSPSVASFSSRGPSLMNAGILKPDITAPGVNILSAYSTKSIASTSFNFQSGTSMAAAHVSGIIALIKNKYPRWSPAAIKSAIITSARDIDLHGNRIFDESSYNKSADIFAMGAGIVNPLGAMDPGLVYDIRYNDYISYLCGLNYNVHRSSFHCNSSLDPEQLNYPSISVSLRAVSMKTVTRTVRNVGEAHAVYLAKIVEPEGVRVDLSRYRLHFSRLDQEESFEIRFSIEERYMKKCRFSEGKLSWISNRHIVSSPISIRF
ncbi:subtilisin-like protease SBT1.2 [Asparagus officinalis]|nr:subtilisin-like protease SBT1.2 [Asparagus officinalis]